MRKNICRKKSRKETKKLKDIHNELNEFKEYMEKLRKVENMSKNENLIFKQIIIYKDEMDIFEKEELKQRAKLLTGAEKN